MENETLDPFDDAVARALDARREQERISRPELSRLSGIPYPTLHRYLKGERAIPMSRFIAIATAMNVEAAEIIEAAQRILEAAQKETGV